MPVPPQPVTERESAGTSELAGLREETLGTSSKTVFLHARSCEVQSERGYFQDSAPGFYWVGLARQGERNLAGDGMDHALIPYSACDRVA